MRAAQSVARSFAWLNVGIGVAGMAGPTVTGNDDRVINLHAGRLLGLPAINPAHALLHLGFGALGLATVTDTRSARHYFGTTLLVFAPLTAAGFAVVRGRPGIHFVMGMAVDRLANYIHLAWAGLGA